MSDGQCAQSVFALSKLNSVVFDDELVVAIPEDAGKRIALHLAAQDHRATDQERGVGELLFEHRGKS